MGYIEIIGCLGAGLVLIPLCYFLDQRIYKRAKLRARVRRIKEEG